MFRNDHDPPHCHVIGADFSAKFTIVHRELLSSQGRIRRRDIREVEDWGQNHRDELCVNWRLARAGRPPQKITDQAMHYEITDAVAHPDHAVTITWADGVRGGVDFSPFIARGELFAALAEPEYFVREMSVLRGGVGLTWPNEVDFSADGSRQDAVPAEYEERTEVPAAERL